MRYIERVATEGHGNKKMCDEAREIVKGDVIGGEREGENW